MPQITLLRLSKLKMILVILIQSLTSSCVIFLRGRNFFNFLTRKEYREENIDVWFIDDSDHCETREGIKQRDGKSNDGKTLTTLLYQQELIFLLSLGPFTYLSHILFCKPLKQLTTYLIHWFTLSNINLVTKWLTDILIYWLSILLIYRLTDLPSYRCAEFMTKHIRK